VFFTLQNALTSLVEDVNQIPWNWEADETLKNNDPIIFYYYFFNYYKNALTFVGGDQLTWMEMGEK